MGLHCSSSCSVIGKETLPGVTQKLSAGVAAVTGVVMLTIFLSWICLTNLDLELGDKWGSNFNSSLSAMESENAFATIDTEEPIGCMNANFSSCVHCFFCSFHCLQQLCCLHSANTSQQIADPPSSPWLSCSPPVFLAFLPATNNLRTSASHCSLFVSPEGGSPGPFGG